METRQETITAGGLEFAYLACGETGPLALCLHGFPDTAWTWRHLLPELAAAGFRAVAPWTRGYAPTALPADGRYRTAAIVADANALHEALGGDGDAVLIGHDWGAIATPGAGTLAPDRWRRLVTMAVPPPGAVAEAFLTYRQLRRSWYIFFFQNPLADIAVAMNDLEFIDHLWADWSPGYTDNAVDLARVKDSLRDPANLAAALGSYRALFDPADAAELAAEEAALGSTPPQPMLYLHGVDDGCMGAEVAARAESHLPVPGSRMEMVTGAGHFLHLERPGDVNRHIVEFATGA